MKFEQKNVNRGKIQFDFPTGRVSYDEDLECQISGPETDPQASHGLFVERVVASPSILEYEEMDKMSFLTKDGQRWVVGHLPEKKNR